MRLSGNLHFSGHCREAIDLYASALGAQVRQIIGQPGGPVWHAEIAVAGQRVLMNDDPNAALRHAASLVVTFDTEEQVRAAYARLAPGGEVLDPLQRTDYSACFVSLVDRYGVRWELMTENADTGQAPQAQDEGFMAEAIALSARAADHGNEPFGAVLVRDGRVVMTNENQIHSASDPTFHAEAGLLRRYCGQARVADLRDYTLYTSCEPCFMCAGAMVWAKLGRVVYAASNRDLGRILGKPGCACSQMVFENASFRPEVTASVLREESLRVLRAYFAPRAGRAKEEESP